MKKRKTVFDSILSRVALLILNLLLVSPGLLDSRAVAQTQLIGFDKIFDQFSSISVWGSLGLTKPKQTDLRESLKLDAPFRYGFELILGPFPTPAKNDLLDSLKRKLVALQADSIIKSNSPDHRGDKTKKLDIVRHAISSIKNSERISNAKAYVGIGIDFSDSYRISSGFLDVRVPVRGYYLSAYVQYHATEYFNLYHGGMCGFYDIYNGTAYRDSVSQYTVTGTTFSFELIPVGFEFDLGKIGMLVEFSYRYLAFDGIRYQQIDKPPYLARGPERLDLSGWHINIGFELTKQ